MLEKGHSHKDKDGRAECESLAFHILSRRQGQVIQAETWYLACERDILKPQTGF